MRFDHAEFIRRYGQLAGPLEPSRQAGLESLLAAFEGDPDLADRRWAAYMLATVRHECADRWQPITEFGATARFDALYGPDTDRGRQLGNTQPGDGSRYCGRGYVQITGRGNYRRLSGALTLSPDDDLEAHPEGALRPALAYRIMSVGMRGGLFTGKKLRGYINATTCDYLNARRIINALDRAETIQTYAQAFDALLQSCAL